MIPIEENITMQELEHRFVLEDLQAEDPEIRLNAIQVLGELGDSSDLELLRERLKVANRELMGLMVAVGKLKKKLQGE